VKVYTRKKSLILDLDETLVHSTSKLPGYYDFHLDRLFVENRACSFYVIKRPHLDYFLSEVDKYYDLSIFTASVKDYASPVIRLIDKTGRFKNIYFRESCVFTSGYYIKDLSKHHLQLDLSQSLIIDNSPVSYSLNEENALPISNFFGSQSDEQLLNMIPLLEILADSKLTDVRSVLRLRLKNQ